ncbi:MAG: hypothetical protein IJS28_00670 [Synergistaceae bacterium]|nr:hypothetical protein [Synergistaceae bacterium]
MLDALRMALARQFVGRPEVHTIDAFMTELVPVHTVRQSVDTYTLKPAMTANVRSIDIESMSLKCKTDGFTPELPVPKISGCKVRQLTKYDIKTHGLPQRRKLNIWKATKKMQSMPIELNNKLKFQKDRPKTAKNESILAWYWPIVDNAVIKLALNKQRGTLLVWYNPGSRHAKARGLYLIRKLGLGEKPEWRWV